MKNREVIFILLSIIILSCEKQEPELNYTGIIIGDYSRSDVDYFTEGLSDSFYNYDIDMDNQSEFYFEDYTDNGNVCTTSGCYMSLMDTSIMISMYNINGEKFSLGDTINDEIIFQNDGFTFYKYQFCVSPMTGETWTSSENYWRVSDGEVGYIAVCYIKPEGKKYGWIKVQDDEINVVDYVLEK